MTKEGSKGLNASFCINGTLKIVFCTALCPDKPKDLLKMLLTLAGTSALHRAALLKPQFGAVGFMLCADKQLMGKSHWTGEQASVLSPN